MERRLAAILAADVVGYSRLMEQDEAGTMAALTDRRKAILEPLLAKYEGRVVRLMGDGTLVEFASVVHAVQCAVDIQKAMKEANAKLSDDRAIVLRIGMNLGDVVVEDGDLYGDSMNIAARLEAMADPGGICLSAAIYQQVERLLPFAFRDLGDQALKNIARPVRVYSITDVDEVSGAPHTGTPSGRTVSVPSTRSVAVLPFTNMSGNAEQQYFGDGISEDIITGLSRFRSLLVIARNSSFQYRDKAVDVRTVARELGVQYVVEGSVRKVDNRIRISAQLIDASPGNHLWAEQYDHELSNLFAVQDEVTQTIVATLEGRIAAGGAVLARRKPTPQMDAYDYVLQARDLMARYDLAAAEPLLLRAIAADPTYAEAYARHAYIFLSRYWVNQDDADLNGAAARAQKALALDADDEWANYAMGSVRLSMRQFDPAGSHYERILAINPNNVTCATIFAEWLTYVGRPVEALQRLDETMRRDPFPPNWYWEIRGMALFCLGRYDEAIAAYHRMTLLHPWIHAYLVAAYAHAGRHADAVRQLALYSAEGAGPPLIEIATAEPYKDSELVNHLIDGLRTIESAG
jgi:adenylate cyclase